MVLNEDVMVVDKLINTKQMEEDKRDQVKDALLRRHQKHDRKEETN